MIESHITAQQYAADLIERCEGDLREAVDVARCMLIQVPWQDRDGEAYWCKYPCQSTKMFRTSCLPVHTKKQDELSCP